MVRETKKTEYILGYNFLNRRTHLYIYYFLVKLIDISECLQWVFFLSNGNIRRYYWVCVCDTEELELQHNMHIYLQKTTSEMLSKAHTIFPSSFFWNKLPVKEWHDLPDHFVFVLKAYRLLRLHCILNVPNTVDCGVNWTLTGRERRRVSNYFLHTCSELQTYIDDVVNNSYLA